MMPAIGMVLLVGAMVGLTLVFGSRDRSGRVRAAMDPGAPPETIERQKTASRIMRAYGWGLVALSLAGVWVAFITR